MLQDETMRPVFALLLVASLGCSPTVIEQPGPRGPGRGKIVDGGAGDAGEVPLPPELDGGAPDLTPDCPLYQHRENGVCVWDELTCANEFPCPDGFECKGGRCVHKVGPCASNDDCPAGEVCKNGTCVPVCPQANPQCKNDADCGPAALCVACKCVPIDQCTKPTPDISINSGGPWQAHQILHLDEALSDFGKVMVSILKKLRDGILGCPPGSSGDCFLFEIIAQFLPQWSKTVIVALGNFGDLIDNHEFIVDSEMSFQKNGKPKGYDGNDHWRMLSFSYQNQKVMKRPEDVPQIGKPIQVAFQASSVCGILYVDKHKIEGVLSGILKWIVDTFIEISTKGQYKTLSAAISGAIDCSKVQDLAAKAACLAFTKGLAQKIDDALKSWLLNYSLMTLKGTAKIDPGAKLLLDGQWDGTLGNGGGFFKNFTGEWSAKR